MTVLIAGGGISGLALALSCHQVGIPFKVFESSNSMRPLGVGINLQPSAVRELYALGLADALDQIGIQTKDYRMYSKKGLHIWTEPRGLHMGYHWPQYSVHRGQLHMLLYNTLRARAGEDAIETGWRATACETQGEAAFLHLRDADGTVRTEKGSVVIGADGIHSGIRAHLNPNEGAPNWGGVTLWRGVATAKPFLTQASMVMVGHDGLRFVSYPITKPDPISGLAQVNWIACRNVDPGTGLKPGDYSRAAQLSDILPAFEGFVFDWLDAPALMRATAEIFEYPMVDRDPLDTWTHGRVTLMGDAAHAAYPVGSNGAGAGILDARKLTARFLDHGLTPKALLAYETEMRPITAKIILMNRTAGPDTILDVVEDRCAGQFDQIEDVISQEEMAQHADTYKRTAGYGMQQTNTALDIIPDGSKFSHHHAS